MTTSINERLKQVRQTLSLTQGKFGERIAISLTYLSDIELSNIPVNERMIKLITSEFKVDEHWLRSGEGEMYSDKEGIAVAKITSLFKSLKPHYQDCAIAQLNSLADLQNANKG